MLSVSDRLILTFFAMLVVGPMLFHYFGPEPDDSPSEAGDHLTFRMDGTVRPIRALDDDEMAAAIKKAQTTVDSFIEVLQSPKSNQTRFSIKVALRHPASSNAEVEGEYVWLADLVYGSGEFRGTIANETEIAGADLGDPWTVSKDEIADWRYVEEGVLVGGFTYRLLRSRLSRKDQEMLDRLAGFRVNDEANEVP